MRKILWYSLLLCMTSCATLLFGGGPALAADQLRVEIPGARTALWLDLEQRRWGVEGDCDGGRPVLRLEMRGELMVVEFEEDVRLGSTRHPFTGEQLFHLEIEGEEGRLHLRSFQGLGEMEMPVTVERNAGRQACSGERNQRK